MIRFAIAAALTLCLAAPALAQTTQPSFPLDAIETSFGLCTDTECCPNVNTTVNAGATNAIYLLANNVAELAGVQTAFEVDPSWALLFQLWDCQGNQVVGTQPTAPYGPVEGTIATAFDCVTGSDCVVVGRMHFITIAGCITQTDSGFPFGTHFIDCSGRDTQVAPECWGSVCVGTPGENTCDCEGGATPVEPSTWGGIKTQYLD